jgi:geranylgeranyl pyrophosphate synthase
VKNQLLDLKEAFSVPKERASENCAHRFNGQMESQESTEWNRSIESKLAEYLFGEGADTAVAVLRGALMEPVGEITARPGKRLRGQLVRMCYRLVSDESVPSLLASRRCQIGADVIELIHAGSLIVDDIEDGSPVRRGAPALHLQFGTPIALNTGNWLYFWPFQLIKEMELPDDRLLCLYERYHSTMLKAHFGQAIDLGAQVDILAQTQVAGACESSLKLKTGALMGFAAAIGGEISGASGQLVRALDDFGRDLGVALQMFDDVGNLIGKFEPSKRYEDLMLRRPSWVWACAANNLSPSDYRRFVAAVRQLPEVDALESELMELDLATMTRASARQHLDRAFFRLEACLDSAAVTWSYPAFKELRQLGEEVAVAYG